MKLAYTFTSLGYLYRDTKNYTAAEEATRRALAIHEHQPRANNQSLVDILRNIAQDLEQ